jgi:hypothetical protein
VTLCSNPLSSVPSVPPQQTVRSEAERLDGVVGGDAQGEVALNRRHGSPFFRHGSSSSVVTPAFKFPRVLNREANGAVHCPRLSSSLHRKRGDRSIGRWYGIACAGS